MKMIQKINNKILFSVFFFILVVTISAFIIEYQFNYQPCKLCIYERIPYLLSIALIIKIFFIHKYQKITLLILSLIFFISSILAFYHFGIEQGFFKESSVCTTKDLSQSLTKEEILEQLNKNIISCKDVSFAIFGLSLATINTIFSICLSVIFARLFLNYGKNQ